MKMTGDLGLPGVLPSRPSEMRSGIGIATPLGVLGGGSRNPFKNTQGVAGCPGDLGPALWMLWMISTGLAPPNREGLLPQVMGGEDGPTGLPEVEAGMTSTTPVIPGTCHVPEIPTIMMTSGPGTGLLTSDPVTSDPGIPGMLAPGPGTLSTTGDS